MDDNDSEKLDEAGETHTNIKVFALPPNEFFNMWVNFEFLYGIKSAWATSFSITKPRFDNDKLILLPSFSLSPVAYVFDYLSLPAKSTNDNFP